MPSQRRRQTVQESNILVPPAPMPTFMIPHFEPRNRKLSVSVINRVRDNSNLSSCFLSRPQGARRDSIRSSNSPRPPAGAADVQDSGIVVAGQLQQFSEWQSSSSNHLHQPNPGPGAGAATGGRRPAAGDGIAVDNGDPPPLLPNPNSLAPPPATEPPAPAHSRSFVTLALPEERAAQMPLSRSRFPTRRSEDPSCPPGAVKTLDVRIEANVKRKT